METEPLGDDRPGNDYEWNSVTRDAINRDKDAWHAKRSWKNRTNPAGSHEHGYRKAPAKLNSHKIGFRKN